MRWQRETAPHAQVLPPPNEEHTPTHLRHAVLRCHQFRAVSGVASRRERRTDAREQRTSVQGRQAWDVLDHHDLRPNVERNSHELPEQAVPGVVYLASPEDAEALARWPADQ